MRLAVIVVDAAPFFFATGVLDFPAGTGPDDESVDEPLGDTLDVVSGLLEAFRAAG